MGAAETGHTVLSSGMWLCEAQAHAIVVDMLDPAAHPPNGTGAGLCSLFYPHYSRHYPALAIHTGKRRGVSQFIFLLRSLLGMGRSLMYRETDGSHV